ncbi:TPA: EpsG family protein [Vibrio metschnikovii]
MIYVFVLIYCSLYFYAIQKNKVNFFILIPPFLIYFLIPALQYDIGSDYFSYIYIYENQWVLDRYFNSGEYFFYYANKFLGYMNAPSQSIFIVFSFFQSLFIFIYFLVLKKRGATLWFLFLLFFTVTGVYHNQLNGIRQYAALTLLPLLTIYLFERKFISYFLGCAIATMFHSSSMVFFLLPLFLLVDRVVSERYIFVFFLLSFPVYLLIGKYTHILLETFNLRYVSYIDSEYFVRGNYINVITKIYYIPALVLFYIVYPDNRINHIGFLNDKYFKFVVLIFSFTYWSFLMSLDIAILSRLASYFWFFIIFPLYYLACYIKKSNYFLFLIYIMYIILPYLAKVTFLAKNEYLYRSYIFN